MGGTLISPGWKSEVLVATELWGEIRRRVLTREIAKRQACRPHEFHWSTLKKILAHEEPPGYRRRRPRRRPTIEPVLPIIRQILTDDSTAQKKQRHTAHRIWQRLRDEHGFTGGYTVVKDAVRELRVGTKEVFLPMSHPPGEAQVDFGFAEAIVAGVSTQVALFVMSLTLKAKPSSAPPAPPPATDVEDLFPVPFYTKLFSSTFEKQLGGEVKESEARRHKKALHACNL
jgi:hypothetical protein